MLVSWWKGAVEQRVTVQATAVQVWALVSVPGWFISRCPGAPVVEKIDDRLSIVHDANYGLRVIRTLELVKPFYAAFQWEVPGNSMLMPTMVQFWVTEESADMVLLKVRESGLAAGVDEADEDSVLEENDEGWHQSLEAVRRFFE